MVQKFSFDPSPEMLARLTACSNVILDTWFTAENIKRASKKFFEFITMKPNKWGIQEFKDRVIMLYGKYKFDVPEAFLKLEVVAKPEKAPRIIINEGIARCLSNLLVICIYEEILFTITNGANVKHQDKCKFFDTLTQKNQSTIKRGGVDVPTTFVEIDQSSFDMSETFDANREDCAGLLEFEYRILTKIVNNLDEDDYRLLCFHDIFDERTQPSTFKFKTSSEYVKTVIMAKREQRVRHSGDRGTSSLNYIVEMIATLCCIFKNPELILDVDFMKTMHADSKKVSVQPNGASKTTFNIHNRRNFLTQFDNAVSFIRFWFEGDDGLLRVSRILENYQDKIIANFHSLGLDCKLFFRTGTMKKPARAEFCGYHILVIDGRTIYCNNKGAYCPDILRSLTKHAFTTSSTARDYDKRATLAASAYLSRSVEFAGRIPWMSHLYKSISDSWRSRMTTNELDYESIKDAKMRYGFEITDAESLTSRLLERHNLLSIDCLPPHFSNALCNASIGVLCADGERWRWVSDGECAQVMSYNFDYTAPDFNNEVAYQHLPSLVRECLKF